MRFTLFNSLAVALLVSAAAQAQEARRQDDPAQSHYRPSTPQNVRHADQSAAAGYVFPARQPNSSVRQAAWNAEFETAAVDNSEAKPAPTEQAREPLRLAPRGKQSGSASASRSKPMQTSHAVGTVGGSLALVLGVFFLFAWLLRKHLPASAAPLPKEVVEMLGRAPLVGRQQLSLLRVGNKLVLLVISPQGSTEALTEVTDPVEVDRLIGLCQSARTGSVANSFRQVLTEVGGERARGFLESEERPRRRAAT